MSQLDPVILPSGAILRIQLAPFGDANALRKALLKELHDVEIRTSGEVVDMIKNALCIGFSSDQVEHFAWLCARRCTIEQPGKGQLKIDKDTTFEPAEARQDYITVMVEVVKANVLPFGKSLFSAFREYMGVVESIQKRPQPTDPTTSD